MIPMSNSVKEEPIRNSLESIYALKKEIGYCKQEIRGYLIWSKKESSKLKKELDKCQKELDEQKSKLFWAEVCYLFQERLLQRQEDDSVIRLRIELDKAEGTVLYYFDTDPKGKKNVFVSETYEPSLFWDITTCPLTGVGFIRKPISDTKVILQLWFPV